MHTPRYRNIALLVGLATALAAPAAPMVRSAHAATIATDGSGDKTLSPYFHVKSEDPNTDQMPLKDTRAEVTVSGVIAHVNVTQTYKNEGKNPLEAVYVFPMSTRAAVFAMRMTIGERVIDAEIEKKAAARKLYEQAKAQGKSASLLEQKRPNVFQMNVANIMPGDTIKVELDYVELLVPDDGIYEFVYPTVVGPRYSEKTALKNPDEKWIANPHLKAGQAAPYTWDIEAKVHAGMPIASLRSPSHKIAANFSGKARAKIDVNDPSGGNRDFVLRYRLGGKKVQTGLLLYPGKDENFFLAMIQPPKRVRKDMRPRREYVFILDVSGSMYGFPLNTAKKVMRKLISGLSPRDRFNVMMFSGGNTVVFESSRRATEANVKAALSAIGQRRGGGGTRILQAVKRALAMPRAEGMSTSFVVVTDGYVAVERETFEVIRKGLGEANLFSFGIGRSVNRYIIEGMARAGMGEPFTVLGPDQADAKAAKFLAYIESPVLTDVKVQFSGLDAYDVVPKSVPDVFAQRPILVFGKYRGTADGHIRVTGINGNGRYAKTLNVASYTAGAKDNESLRYLWARHKIKELSDYRRVDRRPELQEEITELGLKYSLMTPFTSFVAIDKKVRNKDGKLVAVRQPLPMPQGVSNNAVGGRYRKTISGAVATGAGRGYGGVAPTAAAPRRTSRRVYSRTQTAAPEAEPTLDSVSKAEEKPKAGADRRDNNTRGSRASAKRSVMLKLNWVKRVMAKFLAASSVENGRATVSLVVSRTGKVIKVRIIKSNLDARGKKRLVRTLRQVRTVPFSGKALRIQTTLRF